MVLVSAELITPGPGGGRRLGRLAAGCLGLAWLAVGALGSWSPLGFSAGCLALAWLAVGALGSWSPLGLRVVATVSCEL